MKSILTPILFLTMSGWVAAQSPRMTVRQNDGSITRLRIEQADVSVRFLGDIAETVLDLRFRNEGDRAVEGEFVLPLPLGATVSAYALDVNGNMRDGVSVEKERARTAYESVKRRMIDPGIVEREAGNIYRTKVYPVPAKGTKRLRISYNETLPANARGFAYSLPLDFPDSLDTFTCQLRGATAGSIRVTDAVGLEFAAGDAGDLKANLSKTKLAGTLRLELAPPAGPQMIVEDEAKPAFYLSDTVPDIAPRPRPAPGSVLLVWDASESGLDRDHAKEFALLGAWFAKLGKTRVSLRLLRDRLESGGEFEVRGGKWSKLKQALQQVDYDGATALSQLQVPAGQADLVVFVGDGVSTLGSDLPVVSAPLVFLHPGTTATSKSLVTLARASGGTVINLATDSQATALVKLTRQPLRLIALQGADLEDRLPDQDLQPGQRLRIFGSLRQQRAGKLELRYGLGNDPIVTREVAYQPGGRTGGMIRRLYAQRVLAELEQQDRPNRERIVEHCKRHGLVSDFTSLIVLERWEDYVEHGIRPPEKELQAEYDKLVEDRGKQRAADLGGLAWAWPVRLHWFGQRFPGYEARLLPRLRQVGIWKKAVESQFAPAQRDAAAFGTVAGWFDKASDLLKKKPALRTKEEYDAWLKSIDELHAQGPKLAQTPLNPPPASQPLAVSVRGFVVKPGVVTGESGMTLRQAVEKAGGPDMLGSLDNIALYRNAGKVVYNTFSKQYKDVPLNPGDMLVVCEPGDPYFGEEGPQMDPFAASPPPLPPDPRQGPPIREQGDVWTTEPEAPEPFEPFRNSAPPVSSAVPGGFVGGGGIATPATPTGGSPPRPYTPSPRPDRLAGGDSSVQPRHIERATKVTTTVRSVERDETASPEMTAFAQAIAAGRDPEAAYRSLKGGRVYQPHFYPAAARILFDKQHVVLGRRVLSNLLESRPGDVSALRSYAYWLAEFGQAAEADAALHMLPGDDPAALPVLLDRASIQATGGDPAAAAETLSGFLTKLTSCNSGTLAAIALADFNALHRVHADPEVPHPLKAEKANYQQNLAADIRIVVTSNLDEESLRLTVSEPGGYVTSTANSPSPNGGRMTGTGGVAEYMIRRAVPGNYQITWASTRPATVRAVIHTHWGLPNQKSKVVTATLDTNNICQIGEVEFEFEAPVN
jgi:hypothetical protein